MAKGRFLTQDEKNIISELYQSCRNTTAKELRNKVNSKLDREIALSTIQRELKILRDIEAEGRNNLLTANEIINQNIEGNNENEPPGYWQLGLMMHPNFSSTISTDVIPVLFKIQEMLQKVPEPIRGSGVPHFPISLIPWISCLYKVIPDPDTLFMAAYTYTMFEMVCKRGNIQQLDTTVLDQYLFQSDFRKFTELLSELKNIFFIVPRGDRNKTKEALKTLGKHIKESSLENNIVEESDEGTYI